VELTILKRCTNPHLKHYAILKGTQAPPEELWSKNYSEEVCKPFLQECGIKLF